MENVEEGLPLFGGVQLVVDTTLSPLWGDGSTRPNAANRYSVAFQAAPQRARVSQIGGAWCAPGWLSGVEKLVSTLVGCDVVVLKWRGGSDGRSCFPVPPHRLSQSLYWSGPSTAADALREYRHVLHWLDLSWRAQQAQCWSVRVQKNGQCWPAFLTSEAAGQCLLSVWS